jgi:proteasome component ECM29
VSSRYADRIRWLRALLGHVDSDAREAASRLLGIASSALASSATLTLLSEFTSTLDQNRPSRYVYDIFNTGNISFALPCNF